VTSQVKCYCVELDRAPGYETGKMKIRALREWTSRELGKRVEIL
jgi:uncharacterized protein (DUF885 family)